MQSRRVVSLQVKRLLQLIASVVFCVLCVACSKCAPLEPVKLLNLKSANAIPGEYIVTFRSSAALACMSRTDRAQFDPLPGVVPDSPEAARQLAFALAQSVHGKVITVFTHLTPIMFELKVHDAESVLPLAKDPRVSAIEANLPLHLG